LCTHIQRQCTGLRPCHHSFLVLSPSLTSTPTIDVFPSYQQITSTGFDASGLRSNKKEHRKYLKKQLESYQAFFNDLSARGTGVKGVKNVKGEKSEWIIANIIPGFVKEFDLDGDDGPNLASVKQVTLSRGATSYKGSNILNRKSSNGLITTSNEPALQQSSSLPFQRHLVPPMPPLSSPLIMLMISRL